MWRPTCSCPFCVSYRVTKAPTKFGSDEVQAEEVGGARSAEPKHDHSKCPAPDLAKPAGPANVGVGFEPEGATEQTTSVTGQASHVPPAAGGNAAAAAATTSASAASGAAANGVASASTSAAVRAGVSTAGAVVAGAGGRRQGPSTKRKLPATLNLRNVKINRNHPRVLSAGVPPVATACGGVGAAAAATAAATAPLHVEMQTKGTTSDILAATAAAVAGTATSPEESISATAMVARMAMGSLFDAAAQKLSAAKPSSKPATAAAAVATKIAGGARGKLTRGVGEGEVALAGAGNIAKPKRKTKVTPAVAMVVAVEDLHPFGAEVADTVTEKDIFEAASSGSWVGGRSVEGVTEEGPRGALTGVLATAHVLVEKVNERHDRKNESIFYFLAFALCGGYDGTYVPVVCGSRW